MDAPTSRPCIASLMVALLAAPSCSWSDPAASGRAEYVDTVGDGLPDRRVPAGAAGVQFVDSDGDGIPDRRVGPPQQPQHR